MGSLNNEIKDERIAPFHPLKIFDAARRQDRFVYACAPMVRYGKLAFRQTVHHYGVDLAWTPMSLAKEFNRSEFARDSDLTVSTQGIQPPTIMQFGANVPQEFARASTLVAPYVCGVDLNSGCPQSWACAETLGAALMEKRELVRDMVIEARRALADDGWHVGKEEDMNSPKGRSVSVKIRIHDDLRKTIDYLETVIGHPQNRLVDWITIHPRTRYTPSTVPIRTDALEILSEKYAGTLPILLSGDVFDLNYLPFPSKQPPKAPDLATLSIKEDPVPHSRSRNENNNNNNNNNNNTSRPSYSHLSGFMSARGLLTNPAMFAGYPTCPWEAVETFMCNVARAPLPFKLVVHHVSEMCGPGMGRDKSSLLTKKERASLSDLGNMVELIDFLDEKMQEKTGQVGGLRRDL